MGGLHGGVWGGGSGCGNAFRLFWERGLTGFPVGTAMSDDGWTVSQPAPGSAWGRLGGRQGRSSFVSDPVIRVPN